MSTDLLRRRIALSSVALLATSSATSKAAPMKLPSVEIEAPEDVYIVTMADAGASVHAGDTLFTLKSYRITETQQRLVVFQKQIEFVERPFLDGRIDEEIKNLKQKAADAEAINQIHSARLATADGDVRTGSRLKTTIHSIPTIKFMTDSNGVVGNFQGPVNSDLAQYQGALTSSLQASVSHTEALDPNYMSYEDISLAASQAHSQFLDAQIAANQADRKRQEAMDKIALSKQKLSIHQQTLAELTAALNVKAGASGRFVPRVVVGSFVKKGHVLGQIES